MNSRSPRHTPARPGGAVHRPAATPPAVPVSAPINYVAPNAALLIDFDNVTMGIRSDLQAELKNLLASDIIKGKVQLRRAYADWRRYPQYVAPLAESSIDMIMAPAYGSSKKNATDIRLAIDALELVFTRPEIGTFILLSGDSDFSTLVIKLKEYGKYVIGVGMRESSSDLLVMNCDEYYSYNALAGLVRAGEDDQSTSRHDPWELVSQAIIRMQRNGDVMRADRLKQVMQDIDSTFDEKNLGMSKFSRFVQEAAQRGLLTLTKLENGQLEVAPALGRIAASEAAATGTAGVPTTAHAALSSGTPGTGDERLEDRGRRGRRGGRGRGRGREVRASRESPPTTIAPLPGDEPTLTLTSGAPPAGMAAPAVGEAVAPPPANGLTDEIGQSGERLTRDEAFDLVRRAAAAAATGDESARASDVRERAFALLGRDSESLSERNFSRILRDAHDADLIDLRRRGDDYEVALAAPATPMADQLNVAAAARAGTTPAAPGGATGTTPTGSASPVLPRGLGPRGARRGGSLGRGSAPPPELLNIGVVEVGTRLPAVANDGLPPITNAEQAMADSIEPPADHRPAIAKRGRSRAKRAAAEPTGAGAAAKKRARPRSAAKTTDG